jgi:hypothetical protein
LRAFTDRSGKGGLQLPLADPPPFRSLASFALQPQGQKAHNGQQDAGPDHQEQVGLDGGRHGSFLELVPARFG